jgi:hypothetical protein
VENIMITLTNTPSRAQSFAGDVVTIDGFEKEKFVIVSAKQVNYKVGPNAGLTGWWVNAVEVVEANGVLSLEGKKLGFVQSKLFDADDFKTDSLMDVNVVGRWVVPEAEVSPYDALTQHQKDAVETAMEEIYDKINCSDCVLSTDMVAAMAKAAIDAYTAVTR